MMTRMLEQAGGPRVSTEPEVQAQMVSLGGAVILSVCLTLTVGTFIAWQSASVASIQRVILFLLTAASWMYFVDSITERLRLREKHIEFEAMLSRRKRIPLEEVETLLLVQQGYNLERGMQTLEFRKLDRRVERVALGPCWQRHTLEGFLQCVEQELGDPKMLEEVR
jgi:hypothetical protein